jgi:hypothetical protein
MPAHLPSRQIPTPPVPGSRAALRGGSTDQRRPETAPAAGCVRVEVGGYAGMKPNLDTRLAGELQQRRWVLFDVREVR